MNALALYGRYFSASLRSQAQYPAATLMLTLGHCAATSIEILGVFALFDRFGPVGGWSFGEAALFYALVNITFSIADLLTRGFEVFGTDFVRTGAFGPALVTLDELPADRGRLADDARQRPDGAAGDDRPDDLPDPAHRRLRLDLAAAGGA